MTTKETLETRYLVYLGISADGKSHRYAAFDADPHTLESELPSSIDLFMQPCLDHMAFSRMVFSRSLNAARPGSILRCTIVINEKGQSVRDREWVGTYPVESVIVALQTLHDANMTTKRGKKLLAGEKNRALDPFREAYRQANPRQRGALLAQICAYVTGGPS